MIRRDFKFYCSLDGNLVGEFNLDELVFFDIEATGFNGKKDWIFALSFFTIIKGYGIGETLICESIKDEKFLIERFMEVIKHKNLCSYNGKAFDEPFLRKRSIIYGIKIPEIIEHKDLYRELRPYKNGLNLKSLSLKEIEKILCIYRDEEITAMECVNLYKNYLETLDITKLEKIINYNFSDVKVLPHIFTLIKNIKVKKLIREDIIDDFKKKEIIRLCTNQNIYLEEGISSNISKKAGGRILFKLYNEDISKKEIEDIISNSY